MMKDEEGSFILHLLSTNLFVFFQITHGAKGLQLFFVRVLFLELWLVAGFVGDNIQRLDPVYK
jgi:hypothetical protein